MPNIIRFIFAVLFLLIVPAIIFGVSAFRHGHLTAEYLSHWFLGNYLFMAAPHLLVLFAFLTVSSFSSQERRLTVFSLLFLNITLLVFQSWVWFVVPAGESGLAWVLYIPVWVICLLLIAAFHYYRGDKLPLNPSPKRDA